LTLFPASSDWTAENFCCYYYSKNTEQHLAKNTNSDTMKSRNQKSLNRFTQEAEQAINEDLARFYSKLRIHQHSGKLYTFKNWIKAVRELLDELD